MQFAMTLNADNAAFDEGHAPAEIARILRELADRIEESDALPRRGDSYWLRDVNGNKVGHFTRTQT